MPLIHIIMVLFALTTSVNADISSDFLQRQTHKNIQELHDAALALEKTSMETCNSDLNQVKKQFHTVFDKWLAVSYLQFGAIEAGQIRYEIAFWPDPRSKTAKSVHKFLSNIEHENLTPQSFATESVAIKGLYALEYVLYEDTINNIVNERNKCQFIKALTADLARVTNDLLTEHNKFLGSTETIDNTKDYFKSLIFGLEQIITVRLEAPLGTFDRPRPLRAEARRSERTVIHIALSLKHLEQLSHYLSANNGRLQNKLDKIYKKTLKKLDNLDDATLSGVTDPNKRFAIEVIHSDIRSILYLSQTELGPYLGVSAGFNSADGD